MPALNTTLVTDFALASTLDNSTQVLQVICAWPVSGQYGPGSRVLYYVLIATCLLARKVDRLINAFLAVGLILPAVAALHGIVLAALHQKGAVDMDIYGAFQLCSIGILAAPVTVMMSRTFFNDPGRNVMFLWTLLVLIGLLCLGIEFYRIEAIDCPFSDSLRTATVSPNASDFPYAEAIDCGLRCSPEKGPKSPMRGGSADNVYVIPAPSVLTFGTTTLLTAACCVHAILCLLSMWTKVVTISWKLSLRKRENAAVDVNKPDGEVTAATKSTVETINKTIGHYLGMVAIPVFGGAGIAIVILGEINFFSKQVRYQTEPMASVGQWAPIAATALAMIGSLYLIVADDANSINQNGQMPTLAVGDNERGRPRPASTIQQRQAGPVNGADEPITRESNAGRTQVALFLNKMGEFLGSPSRGLNQDDGQRGRAHAYPQVPGEVSRTAGLDVTAETYSAMRSASQAGSFRRRSPSTRTEPRSASLRRRAATLPSQCAPEPDSQDEREPPLSSTRRISSPR